MSTIHPSCRISAPVSGVGVTITRFSDGKMFDFASTGSTPLQFTLSAPTTKLLTLAQNPNNPNEWRAEYATSSLLGQFSDGWYYYDFWDAGTGAWTGSTSLNEIKAGADDFASAGGGSDSSFALLSPMIEDGQFTADALANAPAAGGLATGLVVAGSTAHIVRVSGYPAGQVYKGQQLWHIPTNVCRFIQDQSYASPNYFLILGTGIYGAGTGLDADLPATPTAGDVVAIIP